ncbi:hypothetical protein [Nostoc sp.]|uniref:hypothetical protein n=1 Tax=Nostoc sp. TaxID=1180 RepID=UPI003593E0EF
MLKPNHVSIVLVAAALIIVPTLLTAPASAQTKVYVVGERDQDRDRDGRNAENRGNWNRDRRSYPVEVRNPRDQGNWNRDNEPNSRVSRLRNGDIRYPNGQIIPARSIVRLRNQGYWRLPNGDILLPNQEIVPARRLVRVRDDYFRLPNGLVLEINL